MHPSTNVHPVDELAEIREKLKTLKSREARLRDMIIGRECDPKGDFFFAQIDARTNARLDPDKVRAALGPERTKACTKEVPVTYVKLKGY